MFDPINPPRMPPVPQSVNIVDDYHAAESARAFHKLLGRRYQGLKADIEENQDVLLEYHAATGERLILDQISYVHDTDVLVLQGHDSLGQLCQIVSRSHGIQVMFRIVTLTDERPERKPIGFRTDSEDAPLDE